MSTTCGFCGAEIPPAELGRVGRHQGKALCSRCHPLTPEPPGWKVERVLGEGGMAMVYAAREEATGRLAALKVLRKVEGGLSPKQQKRFRREGQALADLRHPHVLRVYGAGLLEGDQRYLLLEYAEKGSLAQAYERGPLPLRPLARLLGQVARALAFTHERGYVHRDVKPQNVLLDAEWRAKLADFGLVRFASASDGRSGLTAPNKGLGTLAYMSPEQIADARNSGPASDVWALGVSLYEGVTHRLPFNGKTPLQFFQRIRRGHYEPASSLALGVPLALDRLLALALQQEPAARPSAEQFALALEQLARGEVRQEPPPAPPALVEGLVQRASALGFVSPEVAARLQAGAGPTPALVLLREEAGLTPQQLLDLDGAYRGHRGLGGTGIQAETHTRLD